MEADPVSTDRGIDKVMAYKYNRILLIHSKEWNITICNYIAKSYNFKVNESIREDKYHTISLICGF